MFDKILNNILLRENNVLVAVSGGIDSMVLLNFLINFKKNILLHVAHANFKLRYNDSNNDEIFIKNFCIKNNITIHIKKFNTINYANNCSTQMAARYLRYYWFDNLIKKIPCKYIAMGHNLDDVIETFLINIIRGTGIKGLLSIPKINGKIIRPMIQSSREEILKYAKLKKIIWREDLSNKENKYKRNKIRNNIIPLIKQISYNNIYTIVNKTICNIYNDYILIKRYLKTTYSQTTIQRINNPFFLWEIDISKMIERLPSFLKIFLKYGFDNKKNLEKILLSQSGKQMFSKKFRIIKDRNCLVITYKSKFKDNIIYRIDKLNNITKPIFLTFLINCIKIINNFDYEFIDLDKVTLPFYMRNWINGDLYYPLGMITRKRLSKFFKDNKITFLEKEKKILILNFDGSIIISIKLGLGNRFKITYKTKNILTIMYKIP
jgi:tRNA(Ile)-lysidine synthase